MPSMEEVVREAVDSVPLALRAGNPNQTGFNSKKVRWVTRQEVLRKGGLWAQFAQALQYVAPSSFQTEATWSSDWFALSQDSCNYLPSLQSHQTLGLT